MKNTLQNTIASINTPDIKVMVDVQNKLNNLTKPLGSLGKLEEIAMKVSGITRNTQPKIKNKVIVTVASDHGIANEKVSAYPQEVTEQMVYNFLNGGAGINVMTKHINARVTVVDVGVKNKITDHSSKYENCRFIDKKINTGTKNFLFEEAMTMNEAFQSISTGIEIAKEEIAGGADIIGIGEMGIGNTTSSSAIVSLVTGIDVEKVTGRGTGITDDALINKIQVIKKALDLHKPSPKNGLDILSKIGGFEIGTMAGIFLGAASMNTPCVIDGFISGAGALLAYVIEPKVRDYMFASHCSVEIGHKITLDYMGLEPLFDLSLRLGEGTGAALGIHIIEAGVRLLNEMATFNSAGVSEKN